MTVVQSTQSSEQCLRSTQFSNNNSKKILKKKIQTHMVLQVSWLFFDNPHSQLSMWPVGHVLGKPPWKKKPNPLAWVGDPILTSSSSPFTHSVLVGMVSLLSLKHSRFLISDDCCCPFGMLAARVIQLHFLDLPVCSLSECLLYC